MDVGIATVVAALVAGGASIIVAFIRTRSAPHSNDIVQPAAPKALLQVQPSSPERQPGIKSVWLSIVVALMLSVMFVGIPVLLLLMIFPRH